MLSIKHNRVKCHYFFSAFVWMVHGKLLLQLYADLTLYIFQRTSRFPCISFYTQRNWENCVDLTWRRANPPQVSEHWLNKDQAFLYEVAPVLSHVYTNNQPMYQFLLKSQTLKKKKNETNRAFSSAPRRWTRNLTSLLFKHRQLDFHSSQRVRQRSLFLSFEASALTLATSE